MTLLDVVRRLPKVQVIIAHVNHGIRTDATVDAKLVRRVAMSHNLPYEEVSLSLGVDASEEAARTARYKFLRHICKKYNASAIITAHHRDDVLETAIINLLRGTGWRGLSSLRSTDEIIRPFLGFSKDELVRYAVEHSLQWRHDSTNNDVRYLRNHVRHNIVPRMSPEQRQKLHQYIVRQNDLTTQIDNESTMWVQKYSRTQNTSLLLPRYELLMMPRNVAHELLQAVLRQRVGKSAVRPLVERALLFIKVAKAHRTFPIDRTWQLRALLRDVIVEQRADVLSLDNAGVQTGPTLNKDNAT